MDIPLRTQSRALLLRYEHDRPVIESAARDALKQSGQEGDRNVENGVLHPHAPGREVRKQRLQDWAWAFSENEQFAAALVKKEAELGLDGHLPVHLFGCAPLTLLFHLASCLTRRPLMTYQQAPDGIWSLGYDRGQPPAPEDFFEVEGLPPRRQGGHGHVVLLVEVTRSIQDAALAEFQARHGSELLATVTLRPVGGPSPTSFQGPAQAARAVAQFRQVLDALHERFTGAESVLLAMDCPGALAAALGTAVNPNTQHPLELHQFEPQGRHYLPVHRISARPGHQQASTFTAEQILKASQVLREVRDVHRDLVAWLKEPPQRPLVEMMDGQSLLQSTIEEDPATTNGPMFRHLGGKWSFHAELLLGLEALRGRLNAPSDWKECIRLLLVHEVYHVRQGGLTSYNYSGSGRTGFVLEVADFDADENAVQVALAWRRAKQGGTVQDDGEVKTLQSIVWNIVESLRIFEPERPLMELSERRLRRYLIWLFHASRLATLAHDKSAPATLDRVTIEIVGLPSYPDPHEHYAQQCVRLANLELREPVGLALYFQRKLVRENDKREWVLRMLEVFRDWEQRPLQAARDAMTQLFEELFDRYRELVGRAR
ncbi:hypothetical protein SAMN05444354_103174 [Stigmatella aurantiaca]|uniref:SMODS-associated and fused to various effectors domain-containing protein n=1 Tax=Stigmatella aurantiaca TaxID=41 RepID=A0A1H7LBH0_STIAU|nr:SAVED domain-containing protein [Stigmatella aurantiaca]SEK95855.1 hypothetical protein SAMN05444354_103174 [Stigmatella aurantiaca]